MRLLISCVVFLAFPACDGLVKPPTSVNENPVARIVSPEDGDLVNAQDLVNLEAFVWDLEDTAESLAVRWSSDVDGEITTGTVGEDDFTSVSIGLLSIGTHVITVTAQDSDGGVGEDWINMVINGPPTAPVLSISPSAPSTGNDLLVEFDVPSTDPEGEGITYVYEWSVDGAAFGDVTGDFVESSLTVQGQEWSVTVTPFDGRVEGEAGTASVAIVNSAPTAPEIAITPEELTGDMTALTCLILVESVDGDGDNVTYTASWTVDGTDFLDNTDGTIVGDTVDVSYLQANQEWVCTMTPNDGYEDGETASVTLTVTYPDLVVDGTTETLAAGSHLFDDVTLVNGATLEISGEVSIQATNFHVGAGSTVDGKGAGGAAGSRTSGGGVSGGGGGSSAGAGGGAHGGDGGSGGWDGSDVRGIGGTAYGDATSMVNFMGSGGGGTNSGSAGSGGGGGAGLLVTAGTISIDGVIDLDGEDGAGPFTYGGGGGAGGGLLLHGDVISISGIVTAVGGNGGSVSNSSGDGGGGGGGGRIKVFWGTTLTGSCATPGCWYASGGNGATGGGRDGGEDGGNGSTYEAQTNWP
jgi:hypothetical protein